MPAVSGELDSRIAAYELAFRMQSAGARGGGIAARRRPRAPVTAWTTSDARLRTRCLIARRWWSAACAFVQVVLRSGDSKDWDHHDDSHAGRCGRRASRQPIARWRANSRRAASWNKR